MDNLPDFQQYGYQVIAELGRNREGGRITWQGVDLSNNDIVVIKQFCFATVGSSWSGYQACEQEIKLLQQLNHPGIPRYLNSFETDNGFCLIQEYKSAQSLASENNFSLAEIKQIIIKILEILVYLQQQNPPIFHRDIKPENLLIDRELNIYLIDFGFAKIGNDQTSVSSVFKGTPGFIPPEQVIQPTTASDLYSLGVTIICLLTHKTASEIQKLATVNNPYKLKFKPLLPQINPKFINWLEKMVQPQVKQRFPDAASALAALQSLDLTYSPQDTFLIPKVAEIQSIVFTNLDRPIILGLATLTALSTVSVLAINLAAKRIEPTLTNIAIALISGIVVVITQISALIVTNSDPQFQKLATTIAVVIPIVLAFLTAIFINIQEVVGIVTAITLAEAIILAYVLMQQLQVKQLNQQIAVISLSLPILIGIAIAVGINFFFS